MPKKKGVMEMRRKIIVLMLTMFIVGASFTFVPVRAEPEDIKIGVLGPQGIIVWDGLWVGASMAMEEVNSWNGGQGVRVGPDDYRKILLIPIDEHSVPPPDPGAGVLALEAALPELDFIIGGYDWLTIASIREAWADWFETYNKPIWIACGESLDEFIDCGFYWCGACVRCNYQRYRGLFRVTPMNSTVLVTEIIAFARLYLVLQIMCSLYGGSIVGVVPAEENPWGFDEPIFEYPINTYLLIENLPWADVMLPILAGNSTFPELMPGVPNPYPTPPDPQSLLGPNVIITGYDRPEITQTTFDAEFTRIEDTNSLLILEILAWPEGKAFIKQWGELEYHALPFGINVESQLEELYPAIDGKCEYEATLATAGTATPMTDTTVDFYYEYKDKSDDILSAFYGVPTESTYPIYNAYGAYDAVMLLAEIVEAEESLDSNVLIPAIEMIHRTDGLAYRHFDFTGPNPGHNGDFSDYDPETGGNQPYPYLGVNPTMKGTLHDVYVDINDAYGGTWINGYPIALMAQWQAGKREIVWPVDQLWSRPINLPPWMYPLIVDLDYDGFVTIADVSVAASSFGAYPGHYRWNNIADIDNDWFVTISDVSAIAIRFGDWVELPITWPPGPILHE